MIKYSEKPFDYSAHCDTLEELLEAIGRLPSSIKSLGVTKSLCHFQPPSKELQWSEDLVEKSKEILLETLKPEEQEKWGTVTEFVLRSFYGGREKNDAYYINLNSDKSKEFVRKMTSGYYGSLD
jgi:hypothetical protein